MSMYQKHLDESRGMLVKAEAEYAQAVVNMANQPIHLRQSVLDFYQGEIDQAKRMIATFEGAIIRGGGTPT